MEWREKIISIAVIGTSRSIARREKWSAWNLPIRQRNIYDGLRGMDNKEEIFLDRTSLRSKRFRTSRTKSGSAEELFRIRAAWKIWREKKGRRRGVGEGKEGKGRSLPSTQVYRQVKFLSSQMAFLLRRSQMIHIQSLGQMYL